ncbi:MAG: LCP family protein [Clostridiaceae bacterium]|nr:LCP family protein [Clostridiaceae bacterium]
MSSQGPFSRIFPIKFLVLGVVAGLIISIFSGVYLIYADLVSRVTYDDGAGNDFYKIENLMDYDIFVDPDGWDDKEGDSLEGDQDIPGELQRPELHQSGTIEMRQMPGVENILLFGVDSRSNNYKGRSDVTMIISINHNTKKINIVSLMRAMYVKIGAKNHPWGLLNAAYSYGGPGLAMRTVELNYGIPIKGFVAINFNSFIRIVDAIGGVSISLTDREAQYMGRSPGTQRLNGQQALAYARIRKIDSDFQRNQRQRNVINSVLSEMAAQGGSSIYKASAVILANTYTNLNLNDYISKAPSLLSYQRRQLQLPATGETRRYYVGGQEVWWFDMVKTHSRLVNFLLN